MLPGYSSTGAAVLMKLLLRRILWRNEPDADVRIGALMIMGLLARLSVPWEESLKTEARKEGRFDVVSNC